MHLLITHVTTLSISLKIKLKFSAVDVYKIVRPEFRFKPHEKLL